MDNLFATHPSTQNRVAALQAQATEMRRAGQVAGWEDEEEQRSRIPSTRRPGPWA